jgi:hypothetical protein
MGVNKYVAHMYHKIDKDMRYVKLICMASIISNGIFFFTSF